MTALPPPAAAGSCAAGRDGPVHDARELVGAGHSARILLDGQIYTLRITRAGKLILTK